MKTQENKSCIGVWMDHAQAKLLNCEKKDPIIQVINSGFESRIRFEGESGDGTRLGNYRSTNNESNKHAKEDQTFKTYYKKIAEALHPYNDILLFGPTTAHKEFFNFLMEDKSFEGKRISNKDSDYLTENQLGDYVSKWFA